MFVVDKTGRRLIRPTPEEDDAIMRGVALDPDMVEADDQWFDRATRGRPVSAHPKKAVNIRLDQDVLNHFRSSGKGWQTRVNAVLRRAMEGQAADPL